MDSGRDFRNFFSVAIPAETVRTPRGSTPPETANSNPMRIWDIHTHLAGASGPPRQRAEKLLRSADRLGVERLCLHMGMTFNYDPTPEILRQQNDEVLEAIKVDPSRIFGLVYVNPKHPAESLAEFERCVVNGPMVGVKIWVAVRCSDPRLDPIIDRAAAYQAVIVQHTWIKVGGTPRVPAGGNSGGESTPDDFAVMARRHPNINLVCIHVGGDWELGIRSVSGLPNVMLEVSGSFPTDGIVEMAVREGGAKRVIFGSDMPGRSLASQLAKVTGADISDADKELILGGNARRLFAPIFQKKGLKL